MRCKREIRRSVAETASGTAKPGEVPERRDRPDTPEAGAPSYSDRREGWTMPDLAEAADRGECSASLPAPEFSVVPGDALYFSGRAATEVTLAVPRARSAEGPVSVAGEVVASNGRALTQPFVGGRVQLPLGSHVISWLATDRRGPTTEVFQSVRLVPAVLAFEEVVLAENVGASTVLGSYGSVVLGARASAEGVMAKGHVLLRAAAQVQGDVACGGSFFAQDAGDVTGAIHDEQSELPLSALDLLPDGPEPGSERVVISGGRSLFLRPGAYGTAVVRSGGRLVLEPGGYVFRAFAVEPGAVVDARVLPGTGPRPPDESHLGGVRTSHLRGDLHCPTHRGPGRGPALERALKPRAESPGPHADLR